MYRKDTIEIICNMDKEEPEFDNDMFGIEDISLKVMEVSKEVLATSLNNLILDVKDILDNIDQSPNEQVQLSEITINTQVNAQGGFQWIAAGAVGATNSISLTFKINN